MIEIKTDNILGGQSASDNLGRKGQFQSSLGIDPDMPADDDGVLPSGAIRPTQMTEFSGGEITGVPLFMVSDPKDTNLYVIANDGKVHVVTSALAMGTALNSGAALTSSSGNGADYYENYLYLAKNTDVARYGPLNGSPSLTENYWSSTLSLTALTNNTYPSINGVQMPNHFMWRHTDNKLYICDVLSSNAGALHYVATTKTTVEGDTNNGSTHTALDLQYGWWPTVGCSFGTYVLVAFIEGTGAGLSTVDQRPARLILWDTVSDSYEDVTIDRNFNEPLITALQPMRDGSVRIFSGKAGGGCRVDRFYGLNSVQPEVYLPDAYPPLAGAVDTKGDRTAWGSKCTIPSAAACVYSLGSIHPDFTGMGLHNIARCTCVGGNPYVTCLKYFSQSANRQFPIVGWKDDS